MISIDEELKNEQGQIKLIIFLNKLGLDCKNLQAVLKMMEADMLMAFQNNMIYGDIDGNTTEFRGLRGQFEEAKKKKKRP